jgi:TRAP-type mannitol/chloroaromatic compound transport system substrate-binding protein
MADRRRFLEKASGAMAAVAAATIVDAPSVIAQPKVQWRMSTAWPPVLDVMQGSAERLGKIVEKMSGGRFRIEVFAGGQIMPDFACFDAASKGTIEALMGTPSYWVDREPAIEWFQTVPFGMNPEGMAAWYYQGDGLKLWEETYAPFNLVPRQGPAFAQQMADCSGRRSTPSATTKDSRCASARVSATGSSSGRAARPSSSRPPGSSPPSSGA